MRLLKTWTASVHGLSAIVALFAVNILSAQSFQDSTLIFPVKQGNHYIYLNQKGKQVFQKEFYVAYAFSEGLACVRMNGLYGYIDTAGNWAIPAQFHYAYGFEEEIAKVYIGSKAYYINKKGEILFEHNYAYIKRIGSRLLVVGTKNRNEGIITYAGKLLFDTLYDEIPDVHDGHIILKKRFLKDTSYTYPRYTYSYAVVDTSGHICIPFGAYSSLAFLNDRYLTASCKNAEEKKDSMHYIIDMHGTVVKSCSCSQRNCFMQIYHDSLIVKKAIKPHVKEKSYYSYDDTYPILISASGDTLLCDSSLRKMFLSKNRLLAADTDQNWFLYSSDAKRIGNIYFDRVDHNGFSSGNLLWVRTKDGWGRIDTAGNYVTEPYFSSIDAYDGTGAYFVFSTDGGVKSNRHQSLYGLAARDGSVLLEAEFDELDYFNFEAGIWVGKIGIKRVVSNFKGKEIWSDSLPGDAVFPINTDCMQRGYFYANGKIKGKNFIAHGKSGRMYHSLTQRGNYEHGLSIVVGKPGSAVMTNNILSREIKLVNRSWFQKTFRAQDYRLYMWTEALTDSGEWKAIEYLPSSWCGNSYHSMVLPGNSYWQFSAPVYAGSDSTQLRICVRYVLHTTTEKGKVTGRKEKIVYSQTFAGSINPAQFWRKESYARQGIMDPYNE